MLEGCLGQGLSWGCRRETVRLEIREEKKKKKGCNRMERAEGDSEVEWTW